MAPQIRHDCSGSTEETSLGADEKPLDERRSLPALGCNVELTEVTLASGKVWWTLGFESFGTIQTIENDLRAVATIVRLRVGLQGLVTGCWPAIRLGSRISPKKRRWCSARESTCPILSQHRTCPEEASLETLETICIRLGFLVPTTEGRVHQRSREPGDFNFWRAMVRSKKRPVLTAVHFR